MNIIEQRQEARKEKIIKIVDSIKNNSDVNFEKLEMVCCADWGISLRTAKELIKIAKFQAEK